MKAEWMQMKAACRRKTTYSIWNEGNLEQNESTWKLKEHNLKVNESRMIANERVKAGLEQIIEQLKAGWKQRSTNENIMKANESK